MYMVAQIDTFIDSAVKLKEGGVVVVFIVFILIMGWAMWKLFHAYQELTSKVVAAMTEQATKMDAHTRALEANERASAANREAIASVKLLLETMLTRT